MQDNVQHKLSSCWKHLHAMWRNASTHGTACTASLVLVMVCSSVNVRIGVISRCKAEIAEDFEAHLSGSLPCDEDTIYGLQRVSPAQGTTRSESTTTHPTDNKVRTLRTSFQTTMTTTQTTKPTVYKVRDLRDSFQTTTTPATLPTFSKRLGGIQNQLPKNDSDEESTPQKVSDPALAVQQTTRLVTCCFTPTTSRRWTRTTTTTRLVTCCFTPTTSRRWTRTTRLVTCCFTPTTSRRWTRTTRLVTCCFTPTTSRLWTRTTRLVTCCFTPTTSRRWTRTTRLVTCCFTPVQPARPPRDEGRGRRGR